MTNPITIAWMPEENRHIGLVGGECTWINLRTKVFPAPCESPLTCQHSQETLNIHLVPPIIHLDAHRLVLSRRLRIHPTSVQVELFPRIGIDGRWVPVARVTGDVVSEHEDDSGVWDSESFDRSVPVGAHDQSSAPKRIIEFILPDLHSERIGHMLQAPSLVRNSSPNIA